MGGTLTDRKCCRQFKGDLFVLLRVVGDLECYNYTLSDLRPRIVHMHAISRARGRFPQ
jgi:hypothetical protein